MYAALFSLMYVVACCLSCVSTIYIFRIVFSDFHYYSIEIMASGGSQRKLWTEESMAATVVIIKDGKGLR